MRLFRRHPALAYAAYVLALSVGALAGGCSHAPAASRARAGANTGPGDVTSEAEKVYRRGVEELARNQVAEAQKTFLDLKAKHPYSKFAALADLRVADSYMKRSQWLEAIDAYRTFLRFHPSHPEKSYASFQVGEAQMAQVPRDWFFMAPSAEKDQEAIRAAIAAFDELLTVTPEGPMADKARLRLRECGRRLAGHEMYVSRFYARRGHPEGAWGRAETVLAQFPDVGFDAEALWIAGRARLTRGFMDAGRAHLERLLTDYPDAPEGARARALLSASRHHAKAP